MKEFSLSELITGEDFKKIKETDLVSFFYDQNILNKKRFTDNGFYLFNIYGKNVLTSNSRLKPKGFEKILIKNEKRFGFSDIAVNDAICGFSTIEYQAMYLHRIVMEILASSGADKSLFSIVNGDLYYNKNILMKCYITEENCRLNTMFVISFGEIDQKPVESSLVISPNQTSIKNINNKIKKELFINALRTELGGLENKGSLCHDDYENFVLNYNDYKENKNPFCSYFLNSSKFEFTKFTHRDTAIDDYVKSLKFSFNYFMAREYDWRFIKYSLNSDSEKLEEYKIKRDVVINFFNEKIDIIKKEERFINLNSMFENFFNGSLLLPFEYDKI